MRMVSVKTESGESFTSREPRLTALVSDEASVSPTAATASPAAATAFFAWFATAESTPSDLTSSGFLAADALSV